MIRFFCVSKYLVLCRFIPKWFGGTRNSGCVMPILEANIAFARMTFGIVLTILPVIIGYRIQVCCKRSPLIISKWLKKAKKITIILVVLECFVGSDYWFYKACQMKNLITDECIMGWNQLDFINFALIFQLTLLFMICSFVFALILVTIVPLSICTYY